MSVSQINQQRGVGLIEVMVAVLLLSIAVLGFSALQVRAISATDESLVRTKSMTLVRNLAETMRAYPEAYVKDGSAPPFETILATDIDALSATEKAKVEPTIQAVVSSSATETVSVDGDVISILATANNCLSTETMLDTDSNKVPKQPCSVNQLAARDALMIKSIAAEEGIELDIVTCPGSSVQDIQKQMCVITAWSDTKALLDDADDKACANASGIYKAGSHCIISEAY